MISKEAQELLNEYTEYINFFKENPERIKEMDLAVFDASLMLARRIIEVEKDERRGLDFVNNLKKYINTTTKISTGGGDIWWLDREMQKEGKEHFFVQKFYDCLKLESRKKFISYMMYLEKNRKFEKKFFLPRMGALGTVAYDLQCLEDSTADEFKFYGLSQPARTGKSGLCIFFLTWVGMRKPNSHSAMGGHSGLLAKRFFKGYMNIINTAEYTFQELFSYFNPGMTILEHKSADDLIINLGDPDEFATLTCRGIDGTWTGAVDVSSDGYMYVDDLVRDREHSLSPSRLENTFQEYQTKMLDRMNDGAKVLMVGTLWNVGDPLERERRANENNPVYKFKRIPALDENDESNFQYAVKGFSTQYYKDMRDKLDPAEWMAKYQQQPFVREGLIFPIDELRTDWNGILPDGKHRRVAVCDPAFGGGDSLSMPICADFGDYERYIIDWVHDRRTPGYTVPEIVNRIEKHYIVLLRLERNSGGTMLAKDIQQELDRRRITHCKLELFSAPVKMSKEDKISGHSDYVKRHFRFLVSTKNMETDDREFIYRQSEQYRKALDEMVTYTPQGKRIHDDAPDAIVQLAMLFDESSRVRKTEIIRGGLL